MGVRNPKQRETMLAAGFAKTFCAFLSGKGALAVQPKQKSSVCLCVWGGSDHEIMILGCFHGMTCRYEL